MCHEECLNFQLTLYINLQEKACTWYFVYHHWPSSWNTCHQQWLSHTGQVFTYFLFFTLFIVVNTPWVNVDLVNFFYFFHILQISLFPLTVYLQDCFLSFFCFLLLIFIMLMIFYFIIVILELSVFIMHYPRTFSSFRVFRVKNKCKGSETSAKEVSDVSVHKTVNILLVWRWLKLVGRC